MKKLSTCCILLFNALALSTSSAQEKDGVIVIEAESTKSRLGSWKKKTDVKGFSGDCHLEFTGNKITTGSPASPLEYNFTVNKDGIYTLLLKARKRLETEREDLSNDCYVSLKGDFKAAGEVPLKLLKAPTKMFGGNADTWGWAKKLDSDHKKYDPKYVFKAGKKYTLTIHGRSKNFNIDSILFVHEEQSIKKVTKNLLSESNASKKK